VKRSVKALILLLALVVLTGGWMWLKNMDQTETVTEVAGTVKLTEEAAADMTAVSWTDGETQYSFKKIDGTWVPESEDWNVQQEKLEEIAESLTAMEATRKIEEVTSMADYGLEEPAFTVTAEFSDGTSLTWAEGSETPFSDGTYLSLSADSNVAYVTEDALSDGFDLTLGDLAEKESLSEVTAEDVTRLTVGTTLDVTKQEESSTIDPDQKWYDTESGSPMNGDEVETLISSLCGVEWADIVSVNASDDELITMGVDDLDGQKVTLMSGETEVFTLIVGGTDDSGNYYARLSGSAMVYTVSSSTLSGVMTATKESLALTALMPLEWDQVQEAVFTWNGGEVTLTHVETAEETSEETKAETTEEMAEETSEETAETEETEETTAEDPEAADKAIWEALCDIASGDSAEAAGDSEKVLSVKVTNAEGKTVELTFSEYDADHYLAAEDGMSCLVSAQDVDNLVRQLKNR